MAYDRDNANLDWQRNLKPSVRQMPRGNHVLVAYTLRNNQTPSYKTSTTRCVWPGSILTNDTGFFSRRLTVKA